MGELARPAETVRPMIEREAIIEIARTLANLSTWALSQSVPKAHAQQIADHFHAIVDALLMPHNDGGRDADGQ
jgi:hypothetical protein